MRLIARITQFSQWNGTTNRLRLITAANRFSHCTLKCYVAIERSTYTNMCWLKQYHELAENLLKVVWFSKMLPSNRQGSRTSSRGNIVDESQVRITGFAAANVNNEHSVEIPISPNNSESVNEVITSLRSTGEKNHQRDCHSRKRKSLWFEKAISRRKWTFFSDNVNETSEQGGNPVSTTWVTNENSIQDAVVNEYALDETEVKELIG